MRRVGILGWVAILALTVQTAILAPTQMLASIAAERCCADRCQETRSAAMDRNCCGIENPSDSEAAAGRLVIAPPAALATPFAGFDALAKVPPAVARGLHRLVLDTGPPLFLSVLSLRL